MSGEQYKASLKDFKLNAYAFGEKIDNLLEHKLTRPAMEAVALTYDMALDPQQEGKITLISSLTGEKINRFTNVYSDADSLIKRFELQRDMARQTGMCVGARCVSGNIMSALYSITNEMDKKLGTMYHERLLNFVRRVQSKDLAVAGCITDPKGDRSKDPGKQSNPDSYLRVVEEKKDGIVVRGAKVQISGAMISHELLIIPTSGVGPDEKSYALSFSLPTDSPGITYLHGAPAPDYRRLVGDEADFGNVKYGVYNLSHCFFDDVFVPWDQVYMYGETEYTHKLVSQVSPTFRCVTTACKCGHRDLLLGGSALMAEYNGVGNASHIMQKMTDMYYESQLAWGCIVGAAAQGNRTEAGGFYPNHVLANVAKIHGTQALWNNARVAVDISGGMIMCLPTAQDLNHPDLGPLIKKYFQGNPDVPTEKRIALLRLMEYLTGIGCILVAESTQGGAPIAVQQLVLKGELKKKLTEFKQNVLSLVEA